MNENKPHYSMRKNCQCLALDQMWNQVGTIDALLNSLELHPHDESFPRMLRNAISDYKDIAADLIFNNKVDIKDGERRISPGQLYREDPFASHNERYRLYCHSCSIELPKI